MDKDLTYWHAVKQQLNQPPPRTFEEREVWWASVGANVGFEQDGKHEECARPVLVIRKFSRELFLGVPLSTQLKSHPYTTGSPLRAGSRPVAATYYIQRDEQLGDGSSAQHYVE